MTRSRTPSMALGIVAVSIHVLFALGVALFALLALQTPRGIAGMVSDFIAGYAVLGGLALIVTVPCVIIGLVLAIRARSLRAAVINLVGIVLIVAVILAYMARGWLWG